MVSGIITTNNNDNNNDKFRGPPTVHIVCLYTVVIRSKRARLNIIIMYASSLGDSRANVGGARAPAVIADSIPKSIIKFLIFEIEIDR